MRKPLKVAAWSGLVLLIILFIWFFLNFLYYSPAEANFNRLFLLITNLLIGILGALFFFGFVFTGKKFNVGLLRVAAGIGLFLALLIAIVGARGYFLQDGNIHANFGNEDFLEEKLVVWIIMGVVLGVFSILFGLGVKNLGGAVDYSRPVGILNVIAGATYLILIGYFVKLVAFVFEIALLFKASGKSEGLKDNRTVQRTEGHGAAKLMPKKPVVMVRPKPMIRRKYGKF